MPDPNCGVMMRVLDDRPEIWPFILASILIHAIIILALPRIVSQTLAGLDEKPIEVYAVPDSSPANQKNAYQIADIAEPAVQQKPKAAKFLGMFDNQVSEETVGTTMRPGKSGEAVKSRAQKPRRQTVRQEKFMKDERARLFAFNKDLFDERPSVFDDSEKSAGEGGGFDDFYPDFRRGAHTYLNVMRHQDVEYFVRMKRAFKITFNPESPIRDYFSRNQVVRGQVDVVLGVSVTKSGELSELFVFKGSGIPAYDQEALRTVRASAPFSSPPEKFLEEDGLLRMSWTFSVYL